MNHRDGVSKKHQKAKWHDQLEQNDTKRFNMPGVKIRSGQQAENHFGHSQWYKGRAFGYLNGPVPIAQKLWGVRHFEAQACPHELGALTEYDEGNLSVNAFLLLFRSFAQTMSNIFSMKQVCKSYSETDLVSHHLI